MEKRALIAFVLSMIVMVAYQEVVSRVYGPQTEAVRDAPPSPAAEAASVSVPPQEPPAAAMPGQPALAAQKVTVDTDLYTATFTSAGARLESFRLKHYRTSVQAQSPPQEIAAVPPGAELPFGVELRGAQVLSDNGAAYSVQGGDLTLTGDQTGTIDFTWQGDGVTIHKRFSFRAGRYLFDAVVDVPTAPAGYQEVGVSWPKVVDPTVQPGGGEAIYEHAILLNGRKLTESAFTSLADGAVVAGAIGWAGYAGRYFVTALVPSGETPSPRVWQKLRTDPRDSHVGTVELKLLFPLAPGGTRIDLETYAGPKHFDTLEATGHDLSRAVNLGMFEFIAVPLLHVLQLLHRVTRNYGLDIILLTVIIKIAFLPLTQRSMKSMKEMQKLQPQMAKIRERFKDKPDEMNKEMMELYRRHKVNPIGGCLPMLLQIPVFVGLYSALMNTVELRHAPFLLWINDLSAPDRLGPWKLPFVQHPGIPVLTLIMGASMLAQQWMTPSAGDPQQQKVMMIMPIMFTFMFVNFPSGLVLYWLVNNILTIIQQYYMTRRTA